MLICIETHRSCDFPGVGGGVWTPYSPLWICTCIKQPPVLTKLYSGLSMFYFKENYNFLRFQRGSNIFQGEGGFHYLHLGGGGGGLNANLYRNP